MVLFVLILNGKVDVSMLHFEHQQENEMTTMAEFYHKM